MDGTTTNRMRANVLCEDANFISSQTGQGLINLHQKIEFLIDGKMETELFLIPHRHYSIISRIRKEGCLKSEEVTEVGILVEAFPQGKLAEELKKYANYEKK